MSAVMEKRCFSTTEAMAYLSLKRRTFEEHIAPRCTGIKIGTSVLWERVELDAAWEQYKIDAGSERPEQKGDEAWDAKRPGSTKRKPDMTLISTTKASAFDSVASGLLKKRKNG